MGVGKLALRQRPEDMASKQAAAAVGQCELMYVYDELFQRYNHVVGQILLTRDDLDHRQRRAHIEQTLIRLLELGALPIINENDSVATEEISVGDNDTLSALVAQLCQADLLVILSDIDGLYTKDPHQYPDAQLISQVNLVDETIGSVGLRKDRTLGTGGMMTKLHAAKLVQEAGIDMVLINGHHPERIYDLLEGAVVGTRFVGRKQG